MPIVIHLVTVTCAINPHQVSLMKLTPCGRDHTHTHPGTHTQTSSHAHTHTHTHTHTHQSSCTHTHTHTHSHTHIHTHTHKHRLAYTECLRLLRKYLWTIRLIMTNHHLKAIALPLQSQ